jgi:NADPH-dependent glutamate synthase beta subunit-like oxidoreductase/NAD(P)H-flavin reductase
MVTTSQTALVLGIPGFVYADLFSPHGLRRLHDVWRRELDPVLSQKYAAYQAGAAFSPTELSALLCELAATMTPFLTRLFPDIAKPCEAFVQQAEIDAALFREKTDASKRRANKQTQLPTVRPDPALPEAMAGLPEQERARDGFGLTDPRKTRHAVSEEVEACLLCHERNKDSCQKGLWDKQGTLKKNALGVSLSGCPLHEKISEMNARRLAGDPLGALALVMLDNPMCAGTGHRICNDCMTACVFQKQVPINIPEIETSVLVDVLKLPWGVELYGLLLRWNPLSKTRPFPLPHNGKKVLVVGLGPAGYTLVHHLVREGFAVVGIDGLKLEPLPKEQTGDLARGVLPRPVQNLAELQKPLDARVVLGFGGVSEYGITVRWDKNFLSLLYLSLLREPLVCFVGGVRFGGTLTLEDAWRLGFDHVALATGAGKPTLVRMEGNLCRGMRQSSDFLMGLQLSGAFRKDTLANLQVRLPAMVIGGGLTAIDTATELSAYYVVQTEKVLARWETLCHEADETTLLARFDAEERQILSAWLEHGRAFRQQREQAQQENRLPRFAPLVRQFGGVSLVYRKSLLDSPAYRLNHEEVEKCLEEGIFLLEKLNPVAALTDEWGALSAVRFSRQVQTEQGYVDAGDCVELPAKTLCVAAGTSPNTMYETEHPGTAKLGRGGYFTPHRCDRREAGFALSPDPNGVFTSYEKDGRFVSYYGDNHPRFAGAVVRAMASALFGYPQVAALFSDAIQTAETEANTDAPGASQQHKNAAWSAFRDTVRHELCPTVVSVARLTPNIVEVKVHAPQAAAQFRPGQFFRLQNFETHAEVIDGTRLLMEGLALTGAHADPQTGILSLIVLEMGGSSSLCQRLRPGEPVVLLGPTGTPTEIPRNETVCLIGGGLGNAVLFSIAAALKQNGCRVLYFAGYKQPSDLFHKDAILAHTDQVVFCCDVTPPQDSPLAPNRPQDRLFVGNLVDALMAYGQGRLSAQPEPFSLQSVSRLLVIGSDKMMAAITRARHTVLRDVLNPSAVAIGSINSPMQCMMKEICAQCLQKHRDPATGQETVVYSCVNQDQPLDRVDWPHLHTRLRQNSVAEKLAALWIARLLQPRRVRVSLPAGT